VSDLLRAWRQTKDFLRDRLITSGRSDVSINAVLRVMNSAFDDAARPDAPSYEQRVEQMAAALHRDCELEWQAIGHVEPERLITQHMSDAHYGRAHDLVRRIWPELDGAKLRERPRE
jgi:hypothetical protein